MSNENEIRVISGRIHGARFKCNCRLTIPEVAVTASHPSQPIDPQLSARALASATAFHLNAIWRHKGALLSSPVFPGHLLLRASLRASASIAALAPHLKTAPSWCGFLFIRSNRKVSPIGESGF